MQKEATIQQKAMQNIFALDEAVSQFESFGSQLDLGLPTEEDDAPKSFDDMLEVNPSNEPMEFGENFMSEGDDLADKQTQKFVVDEFAKEAAKLPDGNISAADITGISAIIQMNNHITGDVRSFIDQTINHAVQAQQQQNVSDAQPNGTVAPDIAKTGDNAGADVGADVGAEAPVDGGIPTMDPIDPTAEPSLETNPDDGLGLDAGMTADVGDPLAGMDAGLDGAEPAAEEDPLAGMDAGLDGAEPAAKGDATDNGGDSDLDNFLDADDASAGDEDAASDTDKADKAEDDTKSDDDKGDDAAKSDDTKGEEDNDEDFNFEAIADQARGLVEGTEETQINEETLNKGNEEGQKAAAADLTEGVEDTTAAAEETPVDATPVDETPADPATTTDDTNLECNFAEKQARVEAIVADARLKQTVAKANAILESYHNNRERANTLAKLDGVVNTLKQKVLTESIVADYGKKSQKRAQLEAQAAQMYDATETVTEVPSVFEATMDKINAALAAKKPSIASEADKVIAEFEASQKVAKKAVNESVEAPKVDPKQARIDSLLESAAKKAAIEKEFAGKLGTILEGVQKSKANSDLDKQLNNIVNQVKNS